MTTRRSRHSTLLPLARRLTGLLAIVVGLSGFGVPGLFPGGFSGIGSLAGAPAAAHVEAVQAPRSAQAATPTAAPDAAAPAPVPPALDATVARVMKTFDVPGIGLVIVKDGRVVVAKGYGVRKLGSPTPVDAKTGFAIASNTKAFTATALALLVEENKIAWDAPVIQYVPWFQMWDPYVTRELTVRDLLVHRSGLGLGAGDLL